MTLYSCIAVASLKLAPHQIFESQNELARHPPQVILLSIASAILIAVKKNTNHRVHTHRSATLRSLERMPMEPSSCCRSEGKNEESSWELKLHLLRADFIVRVEDRIFIVDRALLIQNCEYFRALFRSGMRECDQEEIHLKGVQARGFMIALSVLRGEQPILDGDEIVDAIECAAFLQVEPLTKHLMNIINTDNCLLMCHTAATYGLLDLFHSSALFLRDAYCDLKDEVRSLPKELVEYTESLTPSTYVTVGTHSPAVEMLQDCMRTVCYLDEDEKDWKVLTDLPAIASTTMAGVTVLDNKLYIVGGVRDISNTVVDSCFCYDATADTWSTFAGPHQPRYNFTLMGHDGNLYAIGGECDRTPMSSVEVYKVSMGVWSHASQLPRAVAGAPSAKAMNRIFICAWKPVGATDILEYIPGKDEWVLLTTLIRPQSYGHYMVGHRDNLYVMRNGPSDDFLRCVMDSYNLTTGQWTAMPGHYGNSKGALFTAVVRGDSVFTFNRTMTLEYTIENNKWKPKREMKGFPQIGSFWTFLLRVPKTTKQSMKNDVLNKSYKKFSSHIDHYQTSFLQCAD